MKELASIVNYGTFDPAVASAFDNNCSANCTVLTCSCTATFNYWSSTTDAFEPALAWFVDFLGGIVFNGPKGNGNLVRAVRGGCVD